MNKIAPIGKITGMILALRGQRVILDRDLALLYGISTKRLNEAVKRNFERFPDDFMFRFREDEMNELVAICDHLKGLKFSYQIPIESRALGTGARNRSKLSISPGM